MPVKLSFRHAFDRLELVHPCIVNKDIDFPVSLDGLLKEPLQVDRLRDVSLDRSSGPALLGNFGDNSIGTLSAGGVGPDHRRSCCCKTFGNFGTDALRGSGDDCDLPAKFPQISSPILCTDEIA